MEVTGKDSLVVYVFCCILEGFQNHISTSRTWQCLIILTLNKVYRSRLSIFLTLAIRLVVWYQAGDIHSSLRISPSAFSISSSQRVMLWLSCLLPSQYSSPTQLSNLSESTMLRLLWCMASSQSDNSHACCFF